MERETTDEYDQVGKFKRDRKTGKYVQRTDRDGNLKYYSDHRGNSNKIAKGILHSNMNLGRGLSFQVGGGAGQLTEQQLCDFMLILDEIIGCEISAYLYRVKATGQTLFHINNYTENASNESKTYPNLINTEMHDVLKYIHTHGHAPNKDVAIDPSEDDATAKRKLEKNYPQIIMVILHNYGNPIQF